MVCWWWLAGPSTIVKQCPNQVCRPNLCYWCHSLHLVWVTSSWGGGRKINKTGSLLFWVILLLHCRHTPLSSINGRPPPVVIVVLVSHDHPSVILALPVHGYCIILALPVPVTLSHHPCLANPTTTYSNNEGEQTSHCTMKQSRSIKAAMANIVVVVIIVLC
jgi:hypothetical protein